MAENHFISTDEARKLITVFKADKNTILARQFQGTAVLPDSETFDRGVFDKVLAQEGCVAIRVFLGMDEKQQVRLVIVGVDSNNEDILPTSTIDTMIIEKGKRCPMVCPPSSAINS